MKILEKKITWTSAGCMFALMAGAPAVADDTELLLVSPNPASRPKPNVMFILDSSGSMDTVETTKKPYDNTEDYSSFGSCDPDALYWTDVDTAPDCTSSNQYFGKSAFQCAYAARQIDGLGRYTDTLVQFRDNDGVADSDTSDDRWDYLEPGNTTGVVECQSDSGTHGDGTSGLVYAASRTGPSNPWTSDPAEEVSWGSAPRNLQYTVYDGNFLNYRQSNETVELQRTDIMKIVTTTILNSVENMNVGVMRFRDDTGGTVLEAVKDLDANRADIVATVNAIPAAGVTPLGETLYESARYWTGGGVDYGDPNLTDPAALSAGNVYNQPPLDSCARNYNVLITDGTPNQDKEAPSKVGNLPDWASIVGHPACDSTSEGACLPDVSEYLGKVDTANNVTGTQTVTTHTIGFTIDLPILKDTAERSGGQYFLANDIESLSSALLQIVSEINDRALSFSAPAVSVNTFNRTRNMNDLYLTVFNATNKTHWPGNLKKYGVDGDSIVDADGNAAVDPNTGFFFDTARSFWTTGGDDGAEVTLGGAARRLPLPANRNLYTNNSGTSLISAVNAIKTTNSSSFSLADFGLTGAANEPTLDDMIDWMRGVDVRDEDNNPATTRRFVMGDPLHSRPAAVVYGGTEANPDVVVYTATNDGYLHAVNGATGEELWSFVPKQLLPNMARLYFDPSAKYKNYGIDGDVVAVINDVDGDGQIEATPDGDFVRLVVGMRRGGTTYFGLDVTNKNAPELMWTRNLAGGGQSWSTPTITRMNIDVPGFNAEKGVVVVGGGYDPVHDTTTHPTSADGAGAGIHILDLESGATLWRAGRDAGATKRFEEGSSSRPFAMTRAFATQIRVADLNADGFADRMYAADMGGQVWRFDVVNGQTPANLVNGGVIAQLGAEGLNSPGAADTRRFYNTPDISIFRDPLQGKRYISVAIGSGYRAHPFDVSAADRFYSLRDPAVFAQLDQNAYDTYAIIGDGDLVEVSGSVQNVVGINDRGWKFTLPGDEKILAGSVTFDNQIFFVSFDPTNVPAASCGAGQGMNFLYRVSVVNGDPIVTNLTAITPGLEDESRREQLAQGGIAPTPTIMFPSPTDPNCTGDDCAPPPVLCIGVECSGPGFANNPVRTLWTEEGIN